MCARFTPRNDALDAVTDIVIMSKSKRPPKGYTSAGDIDGLILCFKVSTIPETYARLSHSKSNPGTLYPDLPHKPSIDDSGYRHSTSDLELNNAVRNEVANFTIRMPKGIRGVDGIPFKLSAELENAARKKNAEDLPELIDPQISLNFDYNFATERQCVV